MPEDSSDLIDLEVSDLGGGQVSISWQYDGDDDDDDDSDEDSDSDEDDDDDASKFLLLHGKVYEPMSAYKTYRLPLRLDHVIFSTVIEYSFAAYKVIIFSLKVC